MGVTKHDQTKIAALLSTHSSTFGTPPAASSLKVKKQIIKNKKRR
jgi:hypothetical protein